MEGGLGMLVSLFGATVMMVGLLPYIEKWTTTKK